MALSYGFFNSEGGDRLYSAEDFTNYLKGIVTNGCFPNDTGLKVVPNPAPIGANPPSVIIKAGKAYFDGLWFENDADLVFSLGSSQQTVTGKYYHVYLRFNVNSAGRDVTILSSIGTNPNPTLPADGAGLYHMPLAIVGDAVNVQPGLGHIIDQRWYAGAAVINPELPVGTVQMYAVWAAPTGWLLCNGLAIPVGSVYDNLRALIGANTPNFQGRTPVGIGASGTTGAFTGAGTILGTGGSPTQALTVGQLPAHNHTISTGAWVYEDPTGGGNAYSGDAQHIDQLKATPTSTVGSGEAHNNMQPYFVINYIIKY